MKKIKNWFRSVAIVALIILAGQLLALDLSPTAAVLPGGADQVQLSFHLAILAALGLAFAMPLQSFIEHAIAEKSWMKTVPSTWSTSPWLVSILSFLPSPSILKPLLPTLISGALGWVATRFGVDPKDALTVAASLTAGAHVVNASPTLAADANAPKVGFAGGELRQQ